MPMLELGEGKKASVTEFSSAATAWRSANSGSAGLTVIEKDGKFYTCTMRDAERLTKSFGYKWCDQPGGRGSQLSDSTEVDSIAIRHPGYFVEARGGKEELLERVQLAAGGDYFEIVVNGRRREFTKLTEAKAWLDSCPAGTVLWKWDEASGALVQVATKGGVTGGGSVVLSDETPSGSLAARHPKFFAPGSTAVVDEVVQLSDDKVAMQKGKWPNSVNYGGQTYYQTGKSGSVIKSGKPSKEYRFEGPNVDSRLWVDEDGQIYPD